MRWGIILCVSVVFLLALGGPGQILAAEPENKGDNKPLSFAADILPLFRPYDIQNMQGNGADLSSYEEVKKNSFIIYLQLYSKAMPCDGAWSEDDIAKFKQWMDSGMQP